MDFGRAGFDAASTEDLVTQPAGPPEKVIRVLSEGEIQERLYGRYGGRPPAHPGPSPAQGSPTWTGAEILQGELERLRSELIFLRKERDRLAQELRQPRPPAAGRSFPFSKFLGFVIFFSVIGYWMGTRILGAAPSWTEPSPYTVQVAVYESRPSAEKGLLLLREMGYPAFLTETGTRSGKKHLRLYVGQFVTREEARIEKERLIADARFSDAFVRLQ